MVKNTSSTRRKSAGSKSKTNLPHSSKRFWRFFRGSIIYLLALYGAHTLGTQYSEQYRDATGRYTQKISQQISYGARNVEKSITPQPPVVIRKLQDALDSPYDNLKLGVPAGGNCSIIIDRPGYALGYSEQHEQALWTIYKLTKEELKSKKARRTDDFRVDPLIPDGSAALEDYHGSFYDRGHLVPAADMAFSLQAMSESFYMSNMTPQRPEFNRGIWKELEGKIRDYAEHHDALYVVSGPVFDHNMPVMSIGSNKVSIPDYFYKILLDPSTDSPKAIGFIIENRSGGKSLADYAVTIDAIESVTGLDFFNQLDPEDEKKLESQCDFQRWEQTLPKKKRSR